MDPAIHALNDSVLEGHKIGVQRAKGPRERRQQQQQQNTTVPRSEYRVHLGNLPDNLSWQQIKDYVGKKAKVVFCDILQESRGRAAIVEFSSFRDMTDAIREFDGKDFMGSNIQFTEDRDHRFGPTRREIEMMRSGKRGRSPQYDRHDDRKRRRYYSPDRYFDRRGDRYPPSPRRDDRHDRRRGDRYSPPPRGGRYYSPERRGGDRDRGYSPERRDRRDRDRYSPERRDRREGDKRRNDRGGDRMSPNRRGNNRRGRRDPKQDDRADDALETRPADRRFSGDDGNHSADNDSIANAGSSNAAPAQVQPEERTEQQEGRRRRRQPSSDDEPAQ
eukprot:CAMPEP_0117445408 /NCGR_PEP_ID=MMETSP0759-20121206/5778_1 /TAXON_ID=63605 /ORGANISM="Percolomonas cosmopolitus, Strain WS" /LENGTH=331 /DNA_ID=CAMNT_0005237579 /DNA_START=506 /DNA_END=1501 /DNA_ORIENTATION=+